MESFFDYLMLFFAAIAMAGLTALTLMFTVAAAVFIWRAMRDD